LRLRLAAVAVPASLLVVAGRYGNIVNRIEAPIVDGAVVGPLITLGTFALVGVLGFVGAEYKSAEALPAELMAGLQTLLSFAKAEAELYDFDARPLLLDIETMLLCILSTVDRRADFGAGLDLFDNAWHHFRIYCKKKSGGHIDLEGPEAAVKGILARWAQVRDNSKRSVFLLPAFTLIDGITLLVIAVVLSVNFADNDKGLGYGKLTTGYWTAAIFSMLVIYLNLLIRSLSEPYDGPIE
jgi:hypothetical protein